VHRPAIREVRADFDDQELTVYQAYSPQIAEAALAAGTFVAPFKRERMTWIKPSFCWMMHRCRWAANPGQERVLAVRISRSGFEWALAHSSLSHHDPNVYADHNEWLEQKNTSPVRIQWDPERSAALQPLPHRAIQVGLSGEAVHRYLDEWITSIHDVTPLAARLRDMPADERTALLPHERRLDLPEPVLARIGAS
jgi:hypothetical protein